MRFEYTAVKKDGKKAKGTVNADSRGDAMEQLRKNDLTVLTLTSKTEEEKAPKSFWQKDIGSGSDIHKAKIPKKVLLSILNQMAIMMKAGVSLPMAMSILIDGQKDKKVKSILQEINKDLFGGIPLSASMQKFNAFPELIVNMVASGEENGHLDTAFERCADIIERELNLKSKIRGAMMYPIILLCLTLVLIIVLNVAVLPQFATLFSSLGADLPLVTRCVMGFSNFLTGYWYVIVIFVVGIIVLVRVLRQNSEPFRLGESRVKLKIPVIGEILRQSYITRFCHIMSSLVMAGVDIVHSLEIARDVIDNLYIKNQLNQVIEDVKIGVPINTSMSRFSTFDTLLTSMIRVGEESGMLTDSLSKMGNLYQEQTDDKIKHMTTLLEPLMIIIIAFVVGTVIVSIVIPMFSMYSLISGSS